MKKRAVSFFTILLIVTFLVPITVFGDIGPKPSVEITFEGMPEEPYFVTLLSETESTGPYRTVENDDGEMQYGESYYAYDIYLKFLEYRDVDGYYFLQYFEECTENNLFRWGYYPPQKFKVLIYFPQRDIFVISDNVLEQYAFDSYFKVVWAEENINITQTGEGGNGQLTTPLVVVKNYQWSTEATNFALRLLLTILIELAVAIPFGLMKKGNIKFIICINGITQVLLNVALNIAAGIVVLPKLIVIYAGLEVAIFGIEAFAYAMYLLKKANQEDILQKVPIWKSTVYALLANVASFIIGLFIAVVLPGMF